MPEVDSNENWDVVIVGGALSGAATACLLAKRNPRLRILILERDLEFSRRVGESTVEISAYFLGRVLGLTEYLNENHLVKQGLRFWFTNDRVNALDESSETGPSYNVRFPGYQVDRSKLDEKVLQNAVAAGVVVRRGVKVTEVTLAEGGRQTIRWENNSGERGAVSARWVVDASGVASLLSRKNGWFEPNREHPIAAIWSRWSGVKNWESSELAEKYPAWASRVKGLRFTATNHLVGFGWWAWVIPLKGGDVSVGIVFDQRLTDLPAGDRLGERLRAMLLQHPVAREIMADATFHEGDVHFRRNLAYRSSTFAGDGFVLVGDAAAFMDPFYSPGMDWISYCANAAAALIDDCCRGKPAKQRVERHNERFRTSYERWFNAIYRDKYFYMGDHELMTLAFRLDLGLYYVGVVSQPFKFGPRSLETPSFASERSRLPAKLIGLYNRRFATIAKSRLARGKWGQSNDRRYFGFRSYELSWSLPWRISACFLRWFSLELKEGWRTWFLAPPAVSERPLHATRQQPAPAQPISAS
ncbi:MAG TPA: NAD(P)/FAD-dependent oxidoreductase [Opitutaceae bacterium]|nr:NAD(P)/FAD-dependent oxidoreductase [Opitutaceae bacterium]